MRQALGSLVLSGAALLDPHHLDQAASFSSPCAGNDRVFAYDLIWEPDLGVHNDRLALDSAWRAWIADQYGSSATAESAWGITAPRDAQGQISNPLDSQIQTDGPWRVMVAAYRRSMPWSKTARR